MKRKASKWFTVPPATKRKASKGLTVDVGNQNGSGVDRISQLPEPIMHQILARLPVKDAKRTCCWSKTWNAAWNSSPVLDFNQAAFKTCSNYRKQLKEFRNYIDECIERHRQSNITIQKFQLVLDVKSSYNRVHVKYVHKWLDYAINDNNLDRLVLNCRDRSGKGLFYLLPEFLFSAKSLEDLDIRGCEIRGNTNIGLSLRKLCLVDVRADQETLEGMFSRCSLLEEVFIYYCQGFLTVKLPGLKLKKVDVVFTKSPEAQSIDIEAPNLRLLSYRGCSWKIKNSIAGCSCKNLKELIVENVDLTFELLRAFPYKFPVLEKLRLRSCLLQSSNDFCCIPRLSFKGCDKIKSLFESSSLVHDLMIMARERAAANGANTVT